MSWVGTMGVMKVVEWWGKVGRCVEGRSTLSNTRSFHSLTERRCTAGG